jgi:hypothetical protein
MRCAKTGVCLQGEWVSDCTGKSVPGLGGILGYCTTNFADANFDWPKKCGLPAQGPPLQNWRLGVVSRLTLPQLIR